MLIARTYTYNINKRTQFFASVSAKQSTIAADAAQLLI